jgi:Protein of unknown function DUF262/Protein of unknown function (DUF1524)
MNDTKSQIAFEQCGLGSVLKHNQLVVPSNQREYSWTERQVVQLFQDFAKAIADDEPGYFLGTIVTIPRATGNLEVVDGQQRLATTAILLAAIRDYLKGKEEVLVESINNEFLTGIDRNKRARVPKLRLNVDDNHLSGWIIARPTGEQEPATTRDSHALLKQAYSEATKHVRNIVSTLDPKDHGDLLNTWVSFVEHRALVVLLRVPNDANAYKMFETLNDRGLRTSQADLIKNYLFGRSGERIQEVQTKWAYMRGALESLEEENITIDFLRHALIAIRGFVREAQVFDVVQDMVKGEQAAITFSSTLEVLANAYVATFNPENEKWNGYPDTVRKAIEVFNLLNIKPMRPLLLAIAAKFSPKEAALAFQFIISLGVRLLIASSTRSGSVELPVAAAANEIFTNKIETAAVLRKKLADITPVNDEFKMAFETTRVSKAQLARYYLRSLEMAAKGESEPWFMPTDDRSVINLEHVLPKKPDGNWPQFTDDEVALYTNRIGNQALLRASDNSELKSTAFSDKKKIYGQSPYVLSSQIAGLGDWTGAAISQRQKALAELALKAWPV